jgi:predicted TIM-barrel fold metal-dependent hydrolase
VGLRGRGADRARDAADDGDDPAHYGEVMKSEEIRNLKWVRPDRTVPGQVRFLPEPLRRTRHFPIFSVDDHLVEPPDIFDGRIPSKWLDRAPRITVLDDGAEAWIFEGNINTNIGMNAVVGRPIEDCTFEAQRFEHMRKGAYNADARIRDMDIDGVYASICFPSSLVGFGGQRLQLQSKDPDLALTLVRALNDWHIESWVGNYRDRLIPLQLPYLLDVAIAAEMIRDNAARGFKAVTFPEAPHKLGLPSLHSGYWDPFVAACEETETVICLHIGSAGEVPSTGAPDAPTDTVGALFFASAMFAAVDWLYSKLPVKFPGIKIAMSEGGLAWVPGLLDRLDHMSRYQMIYGTWDGIAESPSEVFQRNFWHCTLDDVTVMRVRDRIGVERITIEADYPHLDSSWPNTQPLFARHLAGASDHDIRRIAWQNASELFRHPVPQSVIDDPETFGVPAASPAGTPS